MIGNALWATRAKKSDLKIIYERGEPLAKPNSGSTAPSDTTPRKLEITLAAMTCLIVGFVGIASSAAVVILYLNGSLGALPVLTRIVEEFAGKATLFGVGIIGMSFILIIAGYMLLRRSRTGGALALFASTLLVVMPAVSLLVPVPIEPFVAGVIVGVILICLTTSGWESLS